MPLVGKAVTAKWNVRSLLGPEGAARALREQLEAVVPTVLTDLEAVMGGVGIVPPPARYAAGIVAYASLDDYPLVQVIPQRVESIQPLDAFDGAPTYLVRYLVRVLYMVRGEELPDTQAARNRMALAVRLAVLSRLELAGTHEVDDTSLRESYSDISIDDRDQRKVAGGLLELILTAEEGVSATILGRADTLTFVERAPLEHPEAG